MDTISISGHGTATAAPDVMRITVSVESRERQVARAYDRASTQARAVVHSLHANGVAPRDIATTGLNVTTETAWEDGRQRLLGYLASTSLSIILRDLSETANPTPAEIISACVDAGNDDVRLGGFELGFANEAALLAQARDAAWSNALAKAEQYAGLSRRTLGPVLEITEEQGFSSPRPAGFAMKAVASDSMPIERGESEISADVRVRWQLT